MSRSRPPSNHHRLSGDDGLRLVYADYLEEHGQLTGAAFIQVQCELAHPQAGDDESGVKAGVAGHFAVGKEPRPQ